MADFLRMTDEQLALRYVGGDNRAFDELLKRTQTKLYNYILFLVKDAEIADDVFQDTFVKVIDCLHTGRYVESGKFMGFLTRIAHNLVMDYFRKEKKKTVFAEENELERTQYRNTDTFDASREDIYVFDQSMTELKMMMDALPDNQREVVYMRFFQDMSFKEIAETMNCSINTALGRMRYATLNMRKMARMNGFSMPEI